jgi:hypothetical protein
LDRKSTAASLLEKATKYREFARWVGDSETAQRILAFAEELKQRARALIKPSEGLIRKRARELWEVAGRPEGRDVEFWLRAEKELQDSSSQDGTPENP